MTAAVDLQSHLTRLAEEPSDPEALAAIESSFAGEGRWEELLRIYEDSAHRLHGASAAQLLRKAATISLRELISTPRAEAYLQRAISAHPTDREALRELRTIYLAQGDYERGTEIYERELAEVEDTSERAKGLLNLAQVYIESLGRVEKALAALRQAQRIAKDNPEIFKLAAHIYEMQGKGEQALQALVDELAISGGTTDVVDRLALLCERLLDRAKLHVELRAALSEALDARKGDEGAQRVIAELDDIKINWQARAQMLEQRAQEVGLTDKAAAADVWLSVAELQLVYGGDHDGALASIDKALAGKAGHPLALKLLEEVYGAQDRYDDLALKLEMMAAYARDPHLGVELYLKAAMHHSVRLDSPETSARIYERVLQLDPGSKVASNALFEYYRERKNWDRAVHILESWSERAATTEDRVAAHYNLARIFEDELKDKQKARPHYEAVLALDPENQAAARALEQVYRAAGDHAALSRTLKAKLAGLQGDARLPVVTELGELYAGPLSAPAEALDALGEVYKAKPTADMRERLEELAAMSSSFAALVQILEDALERIETDRDKIDALHSLAALYEGARDAPLEALRIHRRILVLDDKDERARSALDRLLHQVAESTDKVAFYREQVDHAVDAAERIRILKKLVKELVETAKDYARALDTYREILKLDANDREAAEGVLAMYRRDNRWAELAEALTYRLEHDSKSPDRIGIQLELARTLEQHLAQLDRAGDCYCEVLREVPTNAEAIAGSERLIGRVRHPLRMAEALQPYYVQSGAWREAAEMIEIRARESDDEAGRADLLRSLAIIYEQRLKRDEEALGALLRAFQADPNDSGLQVELERVAQKASDYEGVVRVYRAAAEAAPDDAKRRLLLRAAALAEKGSDGTGATRDYLRVLTLAEADNAGTLDGLGRLLAAGLPSDELRESVALVAADLSPQRARSFWRTLGRFFGKVQERGAQGFEPSVPVSQFAKEAWKNVLNIDKDDAEALEQLDKLIDSSADPTELANHLRQKIQRSGDEASLTTHGVQLADLLANRLNDVPTAIAELLTISAIAPGSRPVWAKLAELQARAGQPNEAAHSMQSEINLLPDGDDRRNRQVAYAELVGKQLQDVEGALHALQGVLAAEPAHAAGTALLEQLHGDAAGVSDVRERIERMLLASYAASGKWQESANILRYAIDNSHDATTRVQLTKELAQIRSLRLNDNAGAFDDIERVFHEQPSDAELRIEMERLAEAGGLWEQLVTAYNGALTAITDVEQQKPLRRKLAQVLDQKLGRPAEAIEHYKAATGGQLPDDLPSLEALERLYRTNNASADLAEVLDAIYKKTPPENVAKRKALLLEVAQLAEGVGDKPRALDTYKQLIELDPKNLAALRQLDTVLGELNQHAERAEILNKLVDLNTANPQLLDDYLKLANVQMQLGKPEEALKQYRSVLLKKRDHQAAISGLEGLLAQAPNKTEIAQVLEPIYTAKQDHAKLAWVLEQRLEGTAELTQRKGLLRRIGDIYENRLQQKDKAFGMARRSLGEDPADMGVRMWIEKLAGETGALGALADAYVEEAEKADAALKLQFHRRAAAIYHEKLNDHPAAVVEYQAILTLEARDEKALTGLEAIFRSTESYSDLVELLRRRLALTAGIERKREYMNEIATLQSDKLMDFAAAVETYRQIIEVTPEDQAALGKIESLLGQLSRWEELAAFYDSQVKRLADKRGRDVTARRLDLTFRRGRVAEEHFADREGAAEIFGTILQEDPAHAQTIAYLEDRAKGGGFEAMALLERVYKGQGKWREYVELLEKKLAAVSGHEPRREIFVELASTYDRELNAGDMAFLALTRAYNEDRTNLEVLGLLEKQSEKHGNWDELVEVVGVDIDALPDFNTRQALLRKLGDIVGIKLNDVEGAMVYLQQALQYDPADREAMAQLDALLERHQKWAALADLLERRVELATDPRIKSQLLERLATVWGERLHDAEAALRCHKQILEIDPDHPLTLKSMEKLYRELQDWDSLAKNLLRQADVLKDKSDQIRIHAAAGSLFAEELGDMSMAIEHWLKVAELDPAHAEANTALVVLLTSEERWEELATVYRNQLAHTRYINAKADINRRLGVILGEKLGRSEDALASWLEVLQTDPKNVDALRALLGLYTERAMWEQFVDSARRLIPLVSPEEAKEVRFLLAKALGENLGKREEAIKLAREVRATEPHTADSLAKLADMLKNIEAWDEAVIALEKSGGLTAEPGQKVARFYEAAQIHRDRLSKPNDARGAYEAIREVQPDDEEAYTALAHIYRDTNEWRRLVALNEDYVPHAGVASRLTILTEIRDVQDEKLGEKELGFIAACRVYKENPQDLTAAQVLERIGLETGGAEELAAVLEDELENIHDTQVKVASLRRLARLYAEELKDVHQAETALGKILELEPADVEAIDMMAALGAREERFDKQIQALERKLSAVGEDTIRKAILFDIARIWEDRIGDVDEAIVALGRVLEIDGADINALDGLARLFAGESRWGELAHTLTRKVELAHDPKQGVDLRLQVAALCEGELADNEAAIEWYRGVLEFDPGNAVALASLERQYTGLERWSELIQVFEVQIAQATGNEEKIRILSKEAQIYEEHFSSQKDAAAAYERVLALDATQMVAVKQLERLLRVLAEWPRLIELLTHHITLIQDKDEITELYLQIGDIYYRELTRVDKAEEAYTTARSFNENNAAALHALGQLYERSGNWFQALEMLSREAEALGQDPKGLGVLMRVGKINEDMLMDLAAAKTAYARALEIEPNYGPALQAMKNLAKQSADWDTYAEHVIAEAESTEDIEEKTDLFFEAAQFFQNIRQDEQSAIRFYNRALELTPNHLETAKSLGEIYFRNEDWQRADELHKIVVEQIDRAKDAKDYCQKNYRLAYISEKLGDRDRALNYYRVAFEADATYLPALEGLGQALLTAESWEEAQKVFQTILIHHRDALTESEVVDVQWQLGDISMKMNQPDRAYKQFEKALEIDPDHGPSLRALAGLDEMMENWNGTYERLSRLADALTGQERSDVLMRLSVIARDKLADGSRSIEALERARRSGSASLDVLERLAQQYMETRQSPQAVEVLTQAVGMAGDPRKLSELNFLLATVLERDVKDDSGAVKHYNKALDAMPTNIKAFEAIERILTGQRAWDKLEGNYRAMIGRAKDLAPQVRIVLWRNLAELYRRVLKQLDNAIMAYEVIRKLEPGKLTDTQILADLYAEKPEQRKKAIDMMHELITELDNPVQPVKKLRQLYHVGQQFDQVYALASALVCLNEADEEEKKVFTYLQQGIPALASQSLNDDQWPMLLHEGLNGPVGHLAANLYRAAPDFCTVAAKDLNLKKKDFIDVRTNELYLATRMRYVGKLLNVQGVDLYKKSGSMEPLAIVPAQPPALAAGEANDIFRETDQRMLLFQVGRNMSYARPELFLGRVHAGDELRDVLFGLCLVYNRQLTHSGNPREVDRWAQHFERMPPQALKRLQEPAKNAYPLLGKGDALKVYQAAVETTAARAGLIACGDLAAAIRGITKTGETGAGSVKQRIKDLVLFAVSREYFQLRQMSGGALVVGKAG